MIVCHLEQGRWTDIKTQVSGIRKKGKKISF